MSMCSNVFFCNRLLIFKCNKPKPLLDLKESKSIRFERGSGSELEFVKTEGKFSDVHIVTGLKLLLLLQP